jgi:peptide/nickel transport system ATP-binding protein
VTPLYELDHVGFRYRADAVLADVSFRMAPGEHLGIVGESGAGKTTLLRLLLGLSSAAAGTLLADGSPLHLGDRERMRAHRRFAQPVFQDPYSSLNPRQRIGRTVSEPLRSLKLASGADAEDRARDALIAVGLEPDVVDRYPHQFSGGQRQRIAIARALVTRPRVLLADEPVSALDMLTRVTVIDLLERLGSPAAPDPVSLVVVSHDLSIIARLCRTVIVLEKGRMVEQGPTAVVLRTPAHPYTQRLLASIPRIPRG